MAYKVTLEGPDLKLDIHCSESSLKADTPVINDIMRAARALNAVVPLGKLKLTQDANEPTEYEYEFTALDGRKWQQRFRADSIDPLMNFDVSDYWRVSEFAAHRPVRDLLVGLIMSHKAEKVVFDWK